MTLQAMVGAIDLPDLAPNEKLLLIVLGNYADQAWECWPAIKRMAADTGMGTRTITTTLGKLEERGLIHRSERWRKDGSRASNLIKLMFVPHANAAWGDDVDTAPPARNRRTPPSESAGHEPIIGSEGDLVAREPFEEWWTIYPRKAAKKEARKAWGQMTPQINALTLAILMERTQLFADHVVGKDPEHIAHGATWLRGERWNDELPTHRSQTDGSLPPGHTGSARLDSMVEGARIAASLRRQRWTR